MTHDILERKYTMVPLELRMDGGQSKIAGYAAVFNRQSRDLGGFKEVVGDSAFNYARTQGWPNVIARFNHDSNMLLGTTPNTLQLRIDETGLAYEVVPPENLPLVCEWVKRGDVQKSSFAFRTIEDDWATTEGGYPMRTLRSVQLVDVAPVVDPAYVATTAGLRGFQSDDEASTAFREVSAGIESLAAFVSASVEEVRSKAQAGELRAFFVRTDKPSMPPKPHTFGPAAKALLEMRRPA
jgi:HK97 family phage prohead protease